MHISSTLMLIIASIAAALFVGVFVAATIITYRNRRIIQKYKGNWRNLLSGMEVTNCDSQDSCCN